MKRKLSLFTAVIMLAFSLSAVAQSFTDMPAADSIYYTSLEYAVNNKIISGVDGKLLPENPLTIAEAVTFISRAKPFSNGNADLSMVSDVAADAWYYAPLSQAVAAGVITPVDGKLNPTSQLSRRSAWDMLYKAFAAQGTYTPVAEGDKLATRGDFILWLYNYVKPQAEQTTEPVTENTSQTATEFTDLKAQIAQEAMQLALGIRADGSSYTAVTVYKDASQEDWGQGSGSSTSSRPSSGGSTTKPTEAPDDDEPQTPSENETQAPTENETQAPTEYETEEPTYSEYDGPIDNDKDNVIDDPFNDGWTPNPDGNGSGSGGYDEEEDDFMVNDDLEPEEGMPSEEETEAPTDGESESESDTDTETDTDTEESESETETDTETDTDTESETETDTEPQEDAGDEKESSADQSDVENTDNSSTQVLALFRLKDWWFN